jgi:hypothetical protein
MTRLHRDPEIPLISSDIPFKLSHTPYESSAMLDENKQPNLDRETIDTSPIFLNGDELKYPNDEYRWSIREPMELAVKSGKPHCSYTGHILTSLPYWWHSLGNMYLNTMASPMALSKMGQLNGLAHHEAHMDDQENSMGEQKRKR